MKKIMISLALLLSAMLGHSTFAAQIEPSDRGAALTLLRGAYADLAQAKRQMAFSAPLQRSACVQIGKLSALYESNQVTTKDGSGNSVVTVTFENQSINSIQDECNPNLVWQKVTALLGLHDEMVRLLDQEISESK